MCVVFAVPAASSKSERDFSLAGIVVTALSNRRSAVKVKNIVTIHLNLPLLKEEIVEAVSFGFAVSKKFQIIKAITSLYI